MQLQLGVVRWEFEGCCLFLMTPVAAHGFDDRQRSVGVVWVQPKPSPVLAMNQQLVHPNDLLVDQAMLCQDRHDLVPAGQLPRSPEDELIDRGLHLGIDGPASSSHVGHGRRE